MTNAIFIELKEELQNAITKHRHPFRCFTFATAGTGKIARLRTVVLRKTNPDLKLTFYTDKRSKKIIHIKENNKVSLLFYHPEKLLQLRIEGVATINSNTKATKKIWEGMDVAAKREYTTQNAPGSKTVNPSTIEYLDSENHFCTVEITPFKIEYLKIQRPNHVKVRFSKNNENWTGEFLVP